MALQQNMHRRAVSDEISDGEVYWRLCVFWTIYVADQVISLSCGRPASLYINDIDVETPDVYCHRVQLASRDHDDIVRRIYINRYTE